MGEVEWSYMWDYSWDTPKISPVLEHDYRYLLDRKKETTNPLKDYPTYHAEERKGFGR